MAAGLAAELKDGTGLEAELEAGSGGIFEVRLDGRLIFDKAEIGRFPRLGEVSGLVRDLHPELAG